MALVRVGWVCGYERIFRLWRYRLLSLLQSTFVTYPATKQFIKISVTSFSWYEVLLLDVVFLLKAKFQCSRPPRTLLSERNTTQGTCQLLWVSPGPCPISRTNGPTWALMSTGLLVAACSPVGSWKTLPSPGIFIPNLRWLLVMPHQRLSHLLYMFSYTHKKKYSYTTLKYSFIDKGTIEWCHRNRIGLEIRVLFFLLLHWLIF